MMNIGYITMTCELNELDMKMTRAQLFKANDVVS